MANKGFLVPKPSQCPECKGGRNGMDYCDTCEGTGTIFKVNGKTFPDTKKGYDEAQKALDGLSDMYCGMIPLARDYDCGGLGCGTQPCCCV